MALYFNSEQFGNLCFPQYNYKWYQDGFADITSSQEAVGLIRSDVPATGANCSICPYDLLGAAAVGAYVELLHGVQDTVTADIGIIKTSDTGYRIYRTPTGEIPTGGSTGEIPFIKGGLEGFFNKTKTRLYFGCMYYDDNTSNPATFFYYTDDIRQTYSFIFGGLDLIPPRPHYYSERAGNDLVNCTVTDAQISLLQIPNIYPTAQNFECSRVYVTQAGMLMGSDITEANGGSNYGAPVNFEGTFSSADYGNGNFNDYSDSRGNAAPATDTLLSCGLIDIYNPNAGDLRQLSSYLHSTDFIDSITKTWDDPMQSIISLSLFPVAPTDTTPANLILGGVDTEVSTAKLINTHTVSVTFGTIDFETYGEKYGSFLDYSPYTTAQIFLPFIGQHTLQIEDIQKTKIKVDYTIDFLNGDICAQIQTTDSIKRTIETLHGNCAIQIPLTSANYSGVYSSLLGLVGNIASGNIIGAANDLLFTQKVSRNNVGGIGGSAGAHGHFDAYIMLNRPSQVLPENYNEIEGRPLSVGGTVSKFHGLTIGKIECQIPTATEREKEEIQSLFESGVYLL
jgi:hypothetical protein